MKNGTSVRKTRPRLLGSWLLVSIILGGIPNLASPSDKGDRGLAQRHYKAGIKHVAEKRYLKAAESFATAHSLVPNKSLLWNTARSYERGGDLIRARQSYESFLKRSDISDALRAKATAALLRIKRFTAAFRAAAAADSKSRTRSGVGGSLKARKPDNILRNPAAAAAFYKQGIKHLEESRFERAARAIHKAYKADPQPRYLVQAALNEMRSGRYEVASNTWRLYLALPSAPNQEQIRMYARQTVQRVQEFLDLSKAALKHTGSVAAAERYAQAARRASRSKEKLRAVALFKRALSNGHTGSHGSLASLYSELAERTGCNLHGRAYLNLHPRAADREKVKNATARCLSPAARAFVAD